MSEYIFICQLAVIIQHTGWQVWLSKVNILLVIKYVIHSSSCFVVNYQTKIKTVANWEKNPKELAQWNSIVLDHGAEGLIESSCPHQRITHVMDNVTIYCLFITWIRYFAWWFSHISKFHNQCFILIMTIWIQFIVHFYTSEHQPTK